ncbi:uncharacterized protein BO96DRAFT_434460 [Aspergillus niger CBS 101883]|uniref:Uncharacterized protein n=2 Tax=Aspergillus niger TaxID=5061 RepID=A2RBB5_ASPNC|nr:uncharacterized protein BO96DRAFT_434460 [Aspergillus niger CBS 101883]XP_059602988.1 hypothetical protein An18g06140 [Aspergillus niger]PYH56482.1 hypothetical protein BO96DRAFT_434460 [Aspergillus niger CBS 101883]CAK43339.1 hypothetical protein An18g06140 [Aspergillus niger]
MESEESRETAGVRRDRIKRLISCLLEVEEEGGKEKWQGLYRRLSGGRKKSRRNWKDWRGKGRGMNEEEERKMPTRVGAEARVWVLISKLGGME